MSHRRNRSAAVVKDLMNDSITVWQKKEKVAAIRRYRMRTARKCDPEHLIVCVLEAKYALATPPSGEDIWTFDHRQKNKFRKFFYYSILSDAGIVLRDWDDRPRGCAATLVSFGGALDPRSDQVGLILVTPET